MGYIAGIGGANMDIHGRPDRELIMRDSNPGTLHMSLGGVCRNICENLARLDCDVRLVSVVGDDANGRMILDGCREAGINVDAVRVMPGERSSSYVALTDGAGDMFMAMSDMHIIKRMDNAFVDEAIDVLSGADLVVCDGNLSAASMAHLTETCLAPLYLDPVSTAWAKDLAPFIGCFDTVKPNRMELGALAGCRVDTIVDVSRACDVLLSKGVRRVFVSLGQEGMFYKDRKCTIQRRARPYPDVVNATGAGDASMAGIVWASRQGLTADEIVCAAMAAGMITIASPDTNSRELNPENIQRIMEDYIL